MTREKESYTIPPMHPVPERQRKENEMRLSFSRKAEEVLSSEERFLKKDDSLKIGLEIEYSLLDNNQEQVPEELRNEVIAENQTFSDAELGAAQIEMRTDPIDVTKGEGFRTLYNMTLEREQSIIDSAHKRGSEILRAGSNPFVNPLSIIRTDKEKYKLVPNFHNDNKRNGLNTTITGEGPVDVGDAAIIAIMNSVQANIEAKNFSDAIDKLNRSLMISPISVALTGNARFLDEKDTYISDIRMIAWEISHDTRTLEDEENGRLTRVGLPGLYYNSIRDYFQKVSSYPFILHNPDYAFQIGIGLYWRDTRIKFIGDSLVVEFRPMSTQPNPSENLAAICFYTGRLLWSQAKNEPLLPMNLVRTNKMEAMLHGLDAHLWTLNTKNEKVQIPAREIVAQEIEKAINGLKTSNIANVGWAIESLNHLSNRLVSGTPSDQLSRELKSTKTQSRKKALTNTLRKLEALV